MESLRGLLPLRLSLCSLLVLLCDSALLSSSDIDIRLTTLHRIERVSVHSFRLLGRRLVFFVEIIHTLSSNLLPLILGISIVFDNGKK